MTLQSIRIDATRGHARKRLSTDGTIKPVKFEDRTLGLKGMR